MPTLSALDSLETLGLPRGALPAHVAVIMDGNGRWAQQRGLPRIQGHRQGAAAVRETVTQAARLGIGCLTLYSFSLENWRRPKLEVDALMALYAEFLVAERRQIMDNDVRVVQVGRRQGLPAEVLRELDQTVSLSAGNRGLRLCLALNYGSRAEIVDAVRAIAGRVQRGELAPEQIDEALLSGSLYTAGLPDPDLLIRTAGEMRVSNFLLWQISYAELYVTPVLWPDFSAADLNEAIRAFGRRERRFGDVGPADGTSMPRVSNAGDTPAPPQSEPQP
ncbi:Decaprenyl diphosphate synthase-like protein [Phycisphaerae bacterium RAS1]|nr:Decaprenyl diphosphate synthase-like protein [Phycisphaerae bacterium RAS1]